MKKLSHYDSAGSAAHGGRFGQSRRPAARRAPTLSCASRPRCSRKLPENPKGNPLEIARIAGIAAAKRTSDLIPLCHPLMLTHADVEVTLEKKGVRIVAQRRHHRRRPASKWRRSPPPRVAALTVYDMTKALDKSIEIQDLYLLEKTGGKSGDYPPQDPND